MIVKILGYRGGRSGFPGVRYNTGKMESGKGELVLVRNFGALQGISDLRPEDYVHYLKAHSGSGKRIKKPQLHTVISCRGREYSKEQLTVIAEKWLMGMGYGDNPYMLIFHKDTANNHIHMVSTRIGHDGRKINDSFERLRAYRILDRILDRDPEMQANRDIADSLAYSFSTRAQFMMLLECRGYTIRKDGEKLRISKFGRELAELDYDRVDGIVRGFVSDKLRVAQLRAVIEKYAALHDTGLRPVTEPIQGNRNGKTKGYTSDLLEFLHAKFGLEAVFHFSGNKPPYGYTLIDHHKKTVFKGGDILALGKFRSYPEQVTENPETDSIARSTGYSGDPVPPGGSEISGAQPPLEYGPVETEDQLPGIVPKIDLADDIDDEAILGRNRRRKRKARTNTR